MIVIIPARGGSRRIPRKNIRDFKGKPIIAHSINTASKVCSRIIVSTDDAEIASVAKAFGRVEIHNRSEAMAKDEVGTQEVIKNVILDLGIEDNDVVCCLYPAAPFVTAVDLVQSYHIVTSRPCVFVTSVYAHRVEDCGSFYIGHAACYKKNLLLSDAMSGIYPLKHAIDINTEEDWMKAEKMWEEIHG